MANGTRASTIEQSESGPFDYLVTITGGDCNYVSVDDGVGGFTWELENSDCVDGCATCPTVDAEFLESHGTPESAGERLAVPCSACTGDRWNGKLEVPDGDGLRTSVTRIIRNIQRGNASAPSIGDKVWVRNYFGQWVIVSGGDGDGAIIAFEITDIYRGFGLNCNAVEAVVTNVSSGAGVAEGDEIIVWDIDLGCNFALPPNLLIGLKGKASRMVNNVNPYTWIGPDTIPEGPTRWEVIRLCCAEEELL